MDVVKDQVMTRNLPGCLQGLLIAMFVLMDIAVLLSVLCQGLYAFAALVQSGVLHLH